jgi:hypothetical protein
MASRVVFSSIVSYLVGLLVIHCSVFIYLKQRFGGWTEPLSSFTTQLDPIHRAVPVTMVY